jgi:hypothetical protein
METEAKREQDHHGEKYRDFSAKRKHGIPSYTNMVKEKADDSAALLTPSPGRRGEAAGIRTSGLYYF